MKKVTLCAFAVGCLSFSAIAQTPTADSVSLGANYANQIWYGLSSGSETSIPKGKWDIAFPTNNRSVSIRINDGGGVHLWKFPNGDETSWGTIDTAGISTWDESYNAAEDWDFGAFNDHASGGQFDFGWGEYDMTSHNLLANAVFVIKLADGSFKKVIIDKLNSLAGIYYFRYANLDGSNEVSDSLVMGNFQNKNFVYYDLRGGQSLDLEPNKSDWDLLFTQYTEQIPNGSVTMAYPVTGVVTNINEGVIKVMDVDVPNYNNYQSHTWDSARNVIGYDWKTFNMNQGGYSVDDSTVFFLMDKQEDIWKIVFTGFSGSSTGTFYFTKEKLSTTGIYQNDKHIAAMAVYPNPIRSGQFQVVYQLKNNATPVKFSVYDLSGKVVYQENRTAQSGMNQMTINTTKWIPGTYFLSMEINGQKATKKLTVQ